MSDYSQKLNFQAPFSIAVTNLGAYNEGHLRYQWVEMPTDAQTFQKSLKEIGIGESNEVGNPYEEFFISDYDSYIPKLAKIAGENADVNLLNQIAKDYDNLQEEEQEKVDAALELEEISTVNELANLLQDSQSIDDIHIYPGGADEEILGEDLIEQDWGDISAVEPETLKLYFDYEAFGRDVKLENPDEEDWQTLSDEDLGYELVDEYGWKEIGDDTLKQYFDYSLLGYNAKMEVTGDNLGQDFVEFVDFQVSDREPNIDENLLESIDKEPDKAIEFGDGERSESKSQAVTQATAQTSPQDKEPPKEKER